MTATSLSVVFAPTLVEHNPTAAATSSLLSQAPTSKSRQVSKKRTYSASYLLANNVNEEKKCPLASAEELDELDSDEEECSGNEIRPSNSKSASSHNLSAAEELMVTGNMKTSNSFGSRQNIASAAGLANTTSTIISAIAGTSDNASTSIKPDNNNIKISAPVLNSKMEDGIQSGVANPCYLPTSLSAPHPNLTPDHLLCMKFAALEPKVIELLIEEYPKLFSSS